MSFCLLLPKGRKDYMSICIYILHIRTNYVNNPRYDSRKILVCSLTIKAPLRTDLGKSGF